MRLGEIVLKTAAEVPTRTALVFRDQNTSYRELAVAIQRTADAIRTVGIKPGG